MKNFIIKKNKQQGAMLIEVMLACMVLAIGSISYLKLQRFGLQGSYNDYARSQATSIAQGFSDALRSNTGFIYLGKAQKNGFILGSEDKDSKATQINDNCKSSTPGKLCIEGMFNYQKHLVKEQMLASFAKGQSILCFQEHNKKAGYMRFTMIWKDNSSKKEVLISKDACPEKFEGAISKDYLNNSVTIYGQL